MRILAVHRRSDVSPDGRRTTFAIVFVFWLFQFASLTAERAFLQQGDGIFVLIPRMLATLFGIVLSLLIARAMSMLSGRPLPGRLALAVLLAGLAAVCHGIANLAIFQILLGAVAAERATLASYAAATMGWFWNYCSISSILLVLSYARDLDRRERDMQELRGLADSAQLTALRYQLNPHFMFNTLNSIVSLIGMGRAEAAETMVEDLSDYYRVMLDMKMGDEVPLSVEMEMQRLYLGIESTRFGDRIRVQFDIAEDCEEVAVPALILQPLVENAIKHGVARRDGRTSLAISARREGSRTVIGVENDMASAAVAPSPGVGIGLANVARRLQLFFGEDCGFAARADGNAGLFCVTFSAPDRSA